MKKFRETNDGQMFLLPLSLQDFVPSNHPAHFIRKLVKEELDLKEIKIEYLEERGAPPFSPVVMTSLLLYGYMRGVYSSRQLSRACEERYDFSLVTGLNKPDFRTIAKFRKRHSEALKELFNQVVQLCVEEKIVGLEHVAIDGTRIQANAAKDQSIRYKHLKKKTEELQKTVDSWFEQAEKQDQDEDDEFGEDDRGDGFGDVQESLRKFKEAKERLEKRKAAEYKERKEAEKRGELIKEHSPRKEEPKEDDRESLVDPDSRIMKSRSGFIQGYNCQIGVDHKSHVIVSAHVSSSGSDSGELKVVLDQILNTIKIYPKEVSLDTAYFSESNLKLINKFGIRGYVAAGRDPPNPTYMPAEGTHSRKMVERLRKGGERSRYKIRKETVEPVFGNIKSARGFRQFLLRGIKLVTLEFSLACSAHNILKLFNHRMA